MTGTTGRRRLAALDDLPPREGRAISVGGEEIALFRCDGAVRAISNVCPHSGGPLADGIVAGDTVACPLHGRVVDLASGVVSDCDERVRVYPVAIEDDVIYLEGAPDTGAGHDPDRAQAADHVSVRAPSPASGPRERGPLAGTAIGILQARHHEVIADLIRSAGGIPLVAPCLKEGPPANDDALTASLQQVARSPLDLAVFQTGVGVTALHSAAAALGLADRFAERLAQSTVVARGPKPSSALRKHAVRIDLRTAEPHTTPQLIAVLEPLFAGGGLEGYTTLVQHHGAPNRPLLEFLRSRESEVIEASPYSWELPDDIRPVLRLLGALERGHVDSVVFTSAAQVVNLHRVAEGAGCSDRLWRWLQERTAVASLGPACSAALKEHDVAPVVQPARPRMVPLIQALSTYWQAEDRAGPP